MLTLAVIIFWIWTYLLQRIAYCLVFDKQRLTTDCGICWQKNKLKTIFTACRKCKHSPWLLNLIVQTLIVGAFLLLYLTVPWQTNIGYYIFFSALTISIYSDIATMLISRFVSIFLVPVGFVSAYIGLIPISLSNSIAGVFLGYGFLYVVSKIFFLLTKKEGIGQGDLELLAFIGSFIGFAGTWTTLFIAAILGSILGILYIIITGKDNNIRIPFGPFLSFSAMIYVLYQKAILMYLFGI